MPQPVSNTLTVVSGSLLANKISYVVDGQNRNYRGGYGGLSWMSEAEATNNVIFIGNTSTIGRGPADKPLFYPSFNTSDANIIYAANTLPGSPRNLSTVAGAYGWAANNNFFINSANSPIPRIDADGLVLYVDANQPTSYPQTNNDWFDLSGFGNNGTLTNGPSWNSRGYFEFDGADDYVSFGNLGNIGDNQTIEVWFNSNAVQNYRNVLDMNYSTYNPNTGNVGPRLEQYSTSQIVWIWSGNTTNNGIYNFTTLENISANRWYHTVFTLNSGAWQWHLNGTLIQSGTSPQGYITTYGDVNVGRGFILDPSRYFSGFQSSVRIYNKTLSTSEVKQNYFQGNIVTDGLVLMADASNLVSYPKSGTVAYNLTGSLTGSLLNGVGFSQENGGNWTFDGIDDRISFQSPFGDIDWGTTAFTVMGWIKVDSPNDNDWCLLSSATNSNLIFGTLPYPAGNSLYVYGLRNSLGSPNNQVFNFFASNLWPNGYYRDTWLHVTLTYNGNGLSLGNFAIYSNGVSRTLNNGGSAGYSNANVIQLGRSTYGTGPTEYPNLIVYNRALTPTEVAQNYEATKYKFPGQQIVTNGLLLNLEAANKDSYPGTGTTWTNVATNAYNGTLYNGTLFRPNQNGGTIILDGVDDYVASSVNSALGNVATVVMLCYGTPSATDRMYCSFGGYDVYYYGGTNSRSLVFNTGNGDGYGCTGISDATISGLTMYTFVFRTDVSYSNNQIWINTTQQSLSQQFGTENPGLRTFTIGNFHIGGWVYGGYYPNIGVLSTLVYNRQLSSTEIAQNYNAFRAKFGF